MENPKIELGIIGLGKMGGNLALQAVEKGIRVIGKARRDRPDLEEKGVRTQGFGGHPFGRDEKVAAERRLGRGKLL